MAGRRAHNPKHKPFMQSSHDKNASNIKPETEQEAALLRNSANRKKQFSTVLPKNGTATAIPSFPLTGGRKKEGMSLIWTRVCMHWIQPRLIFASRSFLGPSFVNTRRR